MEKKGYEKLSYLIYIQQKNHNNQTICICWVRKDRLKDKRKIECLHCGFGGCASCDI